MIATFGWSESLSGLRDDAVILNRGIPGDTIHGLADRFDVTFFGGHPEKVFIMIGINDVGEKEFHSEEFLEHYFVLLQRLSERVSPSEICVQSILPVRKKHISPRLIKTINERLKSYANAEGFCFIDLHDHFADSTGRLDPKYSVDGIHLTAEGYRVWIESLSPYVVD